MTSATVAVASSSQYIFFNFIAIGAQVDVLAGDLSLCKTARL
jgi:hypothetical protein